MNRQCKAAIRQYAPAALTALLTVRRLARTLAANLRDSSEYDLAVLCVVDADSLSQQISILEGKAEGSDD